MVEENVPLRDLRKRNFGETWKEYLASRHNLQGDSCFAICIKPRALYMTLFSCIVRMHCQLISQNVFYLNHNIAR